MSHNNHKITATAPKRLPETDIFTLHAITVETNYKVCSWLVNTPNFY